MTEPAGPDRIKVNITDPTKQPCFVAIPKFFLLTLGYTIPTTNLPVYMTNNPSLPDVEPDSILQNWNETVRYGCLHLDNYSIHAKDTLFVYDGLEKARVTATNRSLASGCTVGVQFHTYDDKTYHENVIESMRNEKENANLVFGTKLLANPALRSSAQPPSPPPIQPRVGNAPIMDYGMAALIDSFAKAINDSVAKSLNGSERERVREAADVSQFYSILFALSIKVIQDDGTTATSTLPATINPLFNPVLIANKQEYKSNEGYA